MSSTIGTLRPAVFTDQTTAKPTTSPTNMHLNLSTSQCTTTRSPHGSMPPTRPTTPNALGIIDDHMPDHGEGDPFLHPTLRKSIRPADYNYILKLKPHLTATNYTTWRTVIYRALQTESLHLYLDLTFACVTIEDPPISFSPFSPVIVPCLAISLLTTS